MKAIDRAFPYPVVAPFRDDISSNDFGADLDVRADGGRIYIKCVFSIENETVHDLISSGKAGFALHLEAKRLYFRNLYDRLDKVDRIEIHGGDLQGPVEWLPLILSHRLIRDYRPVGVHDDYQNQKFDIRSAEILAVGNGGKFVVEPYYDPLKKMSSIMQILKSDKPHGPYELDATGAKLTIFLSEEDHEKYGELRNLSGIEGILCNALVLPCLIEAVRLLREEDIGTRWNIVLRNRLDEIFPDWRNNGEPLELAQLILQEPLKRGLSDLSDLTGGYD
jgi:hypothetical protein